MKTVGEIRRENLALLIKAAGGNQAFADLMGKVNPSQISQWSTAAPDSKSGKPRQISDASARRIEAAANKPTGWLDHEHTVTLSSRIGPIFPSGRQFDSRLSVEPLPWVTEWDQPGELPLDWYAIVPRYDIRPSAGSGQLAYDIKPLSQVDAIPTKSLRRIGARRENLACIWARGDSMEPTIFDGHTLLVDRLQKTVTNGRIYVLRYGNEIRVKRLSRRYDEALVIGSDNPRYKEEVVPPEAIDGDVEIIGRVVWAGGEM